MKSKTKQLIARIIVGALVLLMILSAVTPYILGAENFKSYSNKNLHISMEIPSNAKSEMERISDNAREFPVNFNLTVRVSYGDIYEETLKENNLKEENLDRKQVYIESKFVENTWNNEDYINNYFKDILDDAKSGYDYEVSKTTLNDIPVWKCSYEGKSVVSEGEYYLTVNNGGLYTIQIDSYMEKMSENSSTINKILDSYTITDLYVPTQEELTTLKDNTKDENVQTNPTANVDNANKGDNETRSNIGIIFGYFLGAIILLAAIISLIIYILRQRKYKKRKKERKKIRVTRRRNHEEF